LYWFPPHLLFVVASSAAATIAFDPAASALLSFAAFVWLRLSL
jgi:hypothetical protein